MLAELTGAEVVHHTRGGARLAEQLNPETQMGAKTQEALEKESWDYVVLQEMSNGPIIYRESFMNSVASLCERIKYGRTSKQNQSFFSRSNTGPGDRIVQESAMPGKNSWSCLAQIENSFRNRKNCMRQTPGTQYSVLLPECPRQIEYLIWT